MTTTRQFLFLLLMALPGHLYAIGNLSVNLETGMHHAGLLQDPLLYCATGRGIDIYNIQDPYSPVLVGSSDTPGICSFLDGDNGLLAAVDGNGVHLYSLSDPFNPLLLARYASERTFTGLKQRDSLFAVSTVPNGVTLLMFNGSTLDSVARIPFNEAVTGLAVSDTLLFIGLANSGLTIYTISDPSQPLQLLPSFPIQVHDLAVADTILFCASGNDGVGILTIGVPSAPETLSSFNPGDFIVSVGVCDSFLCCSGFMESLYVASIHDPQNPTYLHTFPTTGMPIGSATDSEILYVPEGSTGELFSLTLQILYAALDPYKPVSCAVLRDTTAFVSVDGSGLVILDISSPQVPNILSWYTLGDTIECVLVSDTLAFLAGGAAGLTIINVSDPVSPVHLSNYNTPGTLHGIAKRGTVIFLADGGSGLQTISIQDVQTPSFLDSVFLPGYSQDIAFMDSLAIVALGPKGFALVSVQDPENLTVTDTVTDAGNVTCLAAHDTVLFLGTRDESIMVYELVTGASPQLVASYPTPGPVQDLFYANDQLIAACNDRGIQIIDVSDPATPFCSDSLDTPGISSDVHQFLGVIGTADRFSFRLDSFAFLDTIPPFSVSNLSLQSEDSLITLRWINPSDSDYRGSRVIFRNDTFPAHPDDGIILLDHTAEPLSPDSVDHLDLPGDSTRFYYAVYAYDFSQNFSQPAYASGISATDTIPPGEVTQITFTFWDNLLEVRFMTPDDIDLWGIRALFDTTVVPQHIYDGEVFFDKALYPNSLYAETLAVDHGRTYHFTLFSKDSVPNFSHGASASFQTIDTLPPNEVAFQLVEFLNYQIRIVFKTPNDVDFEAAKACYDLTAPPQHPDSGTLFFLDTLDQNTSYLRELSGTILDTTYYFTFFTRDTALNFSAGISCTCSTVPDTDPPDTVSQFSVQRAFPDTVKISWVNPPDSDFYYVHIRYDIDTFPLSPDSGYHITNDGGTPDEPDSADWNPERPGVNLYLSAFAIDRWGNASEGVHAWCTTPTLTTIQSYDPVDGGFTSWLDTVAITFSSPMQLQTLESGIDLSGRSPYPFTVDRGTGNTYLIIPPSFASLDTITITLHGSILDSIGNPFDGNANGIPDAVDDYSWSFFSGMICDYVQDDTINAEDFSVLRDAFDTQDITREVGPCSGSAPYYLLTPDNTVDFEDFAIFIMMWNWSLDTRGLPLISTADTESLICFHQSDSFLVLDARERSNLISGEIIMHGMGNDAHIRRGKGIGKNDLFIARTVEDDLSVHFGMMDVMTAATIATITTNSPMESVDYSYRLVYSDATREGQGTIALRGSLPKSTVLKPVHPNPGLHASVVFGIPKHMHVSLELFDASGRRVARLINRELPAGYHTFTIDNRTLQRRLAAGIYFVRLKTDEKTLIQKCVLLR
jgi:hypothetical protein